MHASNRSRRRWGVILPARRIWYLVPPPFSIMNSIFKDARDLLLNGILCAPPDSARVVHNDFDPEQPFTVTFNIINGNVKCLLTCLSFRAY